MCKTSKVTPVSIVANGMVNPFTGSKKWTLQCGGCYDWFKSKQPFDDNLYARCPACGAVNQWSGHKFIREYNNRMAE